MSTQINESNTGRRTANFGQMNAANQDPFYYSVSSLVSHFSREAFSLFWSVFGPAAQYCSRYPNYAYANASLKP
jgi:hypothetical protein